MRTLYLAVFLVAACHDQVETPRHKPKSPFKEALDGSGGSDSLNAGSGGIGQAGAAGEPLDSGCVESPSGDEYGNFVETPNGPKSGRTTKLEGCDIGGGSVVDGDWPGTPKLE